jgi:hypothetical protein
VIRALGVVVLAHDEENLLPFCLASVTAASESLMVFLQRAW